MAVNGRALAATGLGVLFVWSGVRGWSVLGTIGDIVTGKAPSQPVLYPLQIKAPGNAVGNAASIGATAIGQSVLASMGMEYIGHAYRFGGAPGRNAENPWDCSSFVNFIVGVRAGKAIPGNGAGRYKGTSHGPPTGMWAAWSGMDTVKRSQVQAGDIVVWLGHMGLAINGNEVVNALNPRDKTKVSNIDHGVGRGPVVRFGRLR